MLLLKSNKTVYRYYTPPIIAVQFQTDFQIQKVLYIALFSIVGLFCAWCVFRRTIFAAGVLITTVTIFAYAPPFPMVLATPNPVNFPLNPAASWTRWA